MGGSQTKEMNGSTTPYQDATPPREAVVFKRRLHIDPRSPTDDIARTPIIVDSAPSELRELDPRSPTYGIERTPLTGISVQPETGSFVREVVLPQPRPVSGAALYQPDSSVDVDMTTPQKPAAPSDLSSPVDPLPYMDAQDFYPLLENAEPQAATLAEPTPVQPKLSSQPKKLFPMPQPALAPAKQVPGSRSVGLVARDTNSPSVVVQMKQRRQVAKSMGGIGNQVGIDKENLAH